MLSQRSSVTFDCKAKYRLWTGKRSSRPPNSRPITETIQANMLPDELACCNSQQRSEAVAAEGRCTLIFRNLTGLHGLLRTFTLQSLVSSCVSAVRRQMQRRSRQKQSDPSEPAKRISVARVEAWTTQPRCFLQVSDGCEDGIPQIRASPVTFALCGQHDS